MREPSKSLEKIRMRLAIDQRTYRMFQMWLREPMKKSIVSSKIS